MASSTSREASVAALTPAAMPIGSYDPLILPEMHISQEQQDELLRNCCGEEMIAASALQESQAPRLFECEAVRALPPSERDIAIRFMMQLTQEVGLQRKSWFTAVQLFDSYCAQLKGGLTIDLLAPTCLAVIKIAKKQEVGMPENGPDMHLCSVAANFVNWLAETGYSVPKCTPNRVCVQEVACSRASDTASTCHAFRLG